MSNIAAPLPVRAESARGAGAGAVRGARHRGGGGAAVRLAGGEHEPERVGRAARERHRRAVTYQLKARGPRASTTRCLARFNTCPVCARRCRCSSERASVMGPRGSQSVDLIATDPRDVRLTGRLLRILPPRSSPTSTCSRCRHRSQAVGVAPLGSRQAAGRRKGRARARRRRTDCSEASGHSSTARWRSRRWPTPRS